MKKLLLLSFILLLIINCAAPVKLTKSQTTKKSDLLLKWFKTPKMVYCQNQKIICERQIKVYGDSLIIDVVDLGWEKPSYELYNLYWSDSIKAYCEDTAYYYTFRKTSSDFVTRFNWYRFPKKYLTEKVPPIKKQKWVNVEKLNIREGPGVNYEIIGELHGSSDFPDFVYVIKNGVSNWDKILLKNKDWTDSTSYGWVYSKYLSDSKYTACTIYSRNKEQRKREEEIAKLKRKCKQEGWNTKVTNAILKHEIFIGMTKEQVITSWGHPDDINRTVGSWGVHEQWVYDRGSFNFQYLYFEDGILTSFQD